MQVQNTTHTCINWHVSGDPSHREFSYFSLIFCVQFFRVHNSSTVVFAIIEWSGDESYCRGTLKHVYYSVTVDIYQT